MDQSLQNGANGPASSNIPILNGQNIQLHQPALAISLFSNIQNGMSSNQRAIQQPQINLTPLQSLQLLQQQNLSENNLFQMQNLAHQFVQANPQNSFIQHSQQIPMLHPSFFKEPISSQSSLKVPNDSGIYDDLATKSLFDLQNVAAKGLKSASMIFNDNSKRPYFKKIDLLCDRLLQDLSVTGKAVTNINSHGVAWATKDFIFVFTRIIGAWSIIRDYFYTNQEGMKCVKEEMDPEMEKNFLAWQEATLKFCQSMITTFENLNVRNLRNGNRKPSTTTSKTKSTESFQKIFDAPVIDNEDIQLSGNYLKSAVYKPVSSISSASTRVSGRDDPTQESLKFMFKDILKEFEKDGKFEFDNEATTDKK